MYNWNVRANASARPWKTMCRYDGDSVDRAAVSQDHYSCLPTSTRQINFLVFFNEFGTNKTISVRVCVWSWELTERTTAFARLYFKVLFLKLFFAPKLTVEELLCSVSSNKLLLYCVLLAANKQECFLVKIIKNLQLQQLIRNLGCCSKRLS